MAFVLLKLIPIFVPLPLFPNTHQQQRSASTEEGKQSQDKLLLLCDKGE